MVKNELELDYLPVPPKAPYVPWNLLEAPSQEVLNRLGIKSGSYMPLSEIESSPIHRSLTGFNELDFIYGYSRFSNSVKWGLPHGKISLWAGESGTGKSRIAIDVAKNRSKLYSTSKVLYFQTESTLEDFAGWAKDSSTYNNFICSGESSIDNIIKVIYEVRPSLVFIDSVNEIDEFESGSKKETRRLINGEDGKIGLRQACNDVGCHVVLLGQLNQNGTIKGGTSLPHLVDVALNLTKYDDSSDGSYFEVGIGIKHRYGRKESGIYGIWKHEEYGVVSVSEKRFEDKIWCNAHNVKYETPEERVMRIAAEYKRTSPFLSSPKKRNKKSIIGKVLRGTGKVVGGIVDIGIITVGTIALTLKFMDKK